MINWLLHNSLWLISLGIMGASAGIDGAYMAKLMPPVLGYALNTVSDISSELLMYWYGRLRQFPRNTKRHRMARWLLVGELLLTGYAWLFGWRQLLPIIAALEGERTAQWLAPVLAAFTPTLLIAAGYTQSLLAGRIEEEHVVAAAAERRARKEQEKVEQVEREEFAIEYHAHRRAPNASTYAVMARDGWRCYYCGEDMSDWPRDEIHVDHFYPVVAGGSDDPFNLVVSCKQCNLNKHARIPTADEVHQFKVYLVKTLGVPAKEKVWLLQRVDGVMKQKDIASILEISPSYVSASVREQPDELSEHLATLCAELCTVGEPVPSLTELELMPVASGNGDNVT